MDPENLDEWQEIWVAQQNTLRSELSFVNSVELDKWLREGPKSEDLRVGGVDLSFVNDDGKSACVAYVILSINETQSAENRSGKKKKSKFSNQTPFEVLYQDLKMVELKGPYVPGFLAFRECEPILNMVQQQMRTRPELTPHVLMVDGNGVLHPRKFGLACHVGLKLNLPTIGVAKNLYFLPNCETNDATVLENRLKHKTECKEKLLKRGDFFGIPDFEESNEPLPLGYALKTVDDANNPIYVSVGHLISLETCKKLVLMCSNFRVPEPTRHADFKSREYIRNLNNVVPSIKKV